MRRFCALTILLTTLSLVTEGQSLVYQGNLAPLNNFPTFDKAYLAVYEREHAISLYGPDGLLAYNATPQAPYPTWTNVENASPDSDGSLALAVEYRHEKLLRGGIAYFNNVGKQTAFIDTGSDYLPTQVCFGPDHSIWTIGWRGLNPPQTSTADYFVLRNYTRDGRLLGAFLARSSFEQDPVGPIVGGWQLRSANGRIGAVFYATSVLAPGAEHRVPEWIETDLHGNVVRRVDIPQKTIRAFSSDGSLYALGHSGLYVTFDPATNSWRTVSGVPGGTLLGADGNNLVFLAGGSTVVWSRHE